MTTRVIVKSPRLNHQAVRIEAFNPATGQRTTEIAQTLGDGGQSTFYVHDGTELRISEVPKSEVPVTDPASVNLSFGQKAVGASFNPSGDASVADCKDGFAAVIDQLNQLRSNTTDPEVKRLASVAITEAQSAQMWAVKALTWKS